MGPKFSRKAMRRVKADLGPITFLDYQNLNIISSHELLGREVSTQAIRILKERLDKLSENEFERQFQYVKDCRCAINKYLHSEMLDPLIRSALSQYIDCLRSWINGVGLTNFQHKNITSIISKGTSIDEIDLALFLQNDNVGCQSGVYRANDGYLYIWHTEEDIERKKHSRFDKLRLASFTIPSNSQPIRIFSFIYPDLLPGPAFNWRSDGFIQLVDALFLKQNFAFCGLLANIAIWVTLFIDSEIPLPEIIASFFPYSDGYALTAIKRYGSKVKVYKVEFASEKMTVESLGENVGDFLFQVNVVSQKDSQIALQYESIAEKERLLYEKRISRTNRIVKSIPIHGDTLKDIFELVTSRSGDEFAYSNNDVKAYFIAKLSLDTMYIWVGSGPALSDDIPVQFNISL